MTQIEEPGLAARIRKRDPAALEAVVREYLGQLLRTALAAGLEPSLAEEAVQDTFTVFLKRAADFEGRSLVRTWLFGILFRKIAEARRKSRRDARMDDIDELVQRRFTPDGKWRQPPLPVESQVYRRQVRRYLEDCLDEVTDLQRMAFVLREVEELGSQEICKILDVTDTHLSVLVYRARNRLRECLEKKGIQGHSAS